MPREFHHGEVRLTYPDNWTVELEEGDEGWAATLQSPGLAFLLLRCDATLPSAESLADEALAALQTEYPELEADDCFETVSGQPTVGHNIRFFSLDLTNTCWIRSLFSEEGTLLLYCQFNDRDEEEQEQTMRAIYQSIRVGEE